MRQCALGARIRLSPIDLEHQGGRYQVASGTIAMFGSFDQAAAAGDEFAQFLNNAFVQKPLVGMLVSRAQIAPHVDRAAFEELLNPGDYLGRLGVMVDRVLAGM